MSDRTGSQIDHLNLAVPDLRAANRFYRPVLATLDIHPVLDIPATPTDPAMTGYGWPEAKPFLWFIDNGTVGTNMHLALTAPDRDHVHTFYESALEHGAHPLHPPRTRPEYHEHYYGAFVLDPHDINLEAVCHTHRTCRTCPQAVGKGLARSQSRWDRQQTSLDVMLKITCAY